ncbi:type II toxin-antitoxin system HicB family antitoxin [Bacillus thuringiensis]|uniref:type II toxin-antitoxin system HicB family antitoxin n=1 Tax=Bacillus thuringiensis TaxID=1428 RepID=UPI0015CF3E9A|nr:type II toxin-antitoxin system HicB family antitoxin [Bacillus thuringiensis]
MIKEYTYPAVFTIDNDKYVVSLPDFPNCSTYGRTKVEALKMAKEALEFSIIDYLDKSAKLPEPSPHMLIEEWNGEIIVDITIELGDEAKVLGVLHDDYPEEEQHEITAISKEEAQRAVNRAENGLKDSQIYKLQEQEEQKKESQKPAMMPSIDDL